MSSKSEKKQADGNAESAPANDQGIREGRPNPGGPDEQRDGVHKSGYGGEGGNPRSPSQDREKPHKK